VSDTPRTDVADQADEDSHKGRDDWVTHGYSSAGWNFARTLERDNTSLREQLRLAQEQLKWIDVKERLPNGRRPVLVHGGVAYWTGAQWMTMMDCPHRKIEWEVSEWKPLPIPPTKVEGSK
jgi:hypothetical protein